jgi:putative flippase GtrA
MRLPLPPAVQRLWGVALVRFLFVGAINTLFGYSVFAFFVLIGLHYALAALLGTVLGILFNFKTTGTIVFKNHDNRLILRFFGVYGFMYVIGVANLKLFKELGVHVLVTAAVFTLPGALLSFWLMRRFVFGESQGALRSDIRQAFQEVKIVLNDLLAVPTQSTLVQFFRYTVVGGVAFVVDFGLLYAFTHYGGVYYLTSATLAFVVGLVINYTFSVRWVFSRRAVSNRWVEFGLFALVGVLGLGLNDLSMWLLTSVAGFYYLYSKLMTTALVFVWNFAVRKVSLFR